MRTGVWCVAWAAAGLLGVAWGAAGAGSAPLSGPSSASAPASGAASKPQITAASTVSGGSYIGVMLRSRDVAKQALSRVNLDTISKALAIYTVSHNKYPASLDELVKAGLLDAKTLESPLDVRQHCVYISGATLASPNDRILVYEPVSYNGQVMVLRVDRTIEAVSEADLEKELGKP